MSKRPTKSRAESYRGALADRFLQAADEAGGVTKAVTTGLVKVGTKGYAALKYTTEAAELVLQDVDPRLPNGGRAGREYSNIGLKGEMSGVKNMAKLQSAAIAYEVIGGGMRRAEQRQNKGRKRQ